MPLTAEELEALATSPQSASGDTGSRTERSADDIKKLLEMAAAAESAGTNENGGAKTAMRFVGFSKIKNTGAV